MPSYTFNLGKRIFIVFLSIVSMQVPLTSSLSRQGKSHMLSKSRTGQLEISTSFRGHFSRPRSSRIGTLSIYSRSSGSSDNAQVSRRPFQLYPPSKDRELSFRQLFNSPKSKSKDPQSHRDCKLVIFSMPNTLTHEKSCSSKVLSFVNRDKSTNDSMATDLIDNSSRSTGTLSSTHGASVVSRLRCFMDDKLSTSLILTCRNLSSSTGTLFIDENEEIRIGLSAVPHKANSDRFVRPANISMGKCMSASLSTLHRIETRFSCGMREILSSNRLAFSRNPGRDCPAGRSSAMRMKTETSFASSEKSLFSTRTLPCVTKSNPSPTTNDTDVFI